MPPYPENDPQNNSSEFDLDFNPPKSALTPIPSLPAQIDSAAPVDPPPKSRLLRILTPWKLLTVLIVCMIFRGVMNIDSKEDSEQSESIERVMTAITATKEAYSAQASLTPSLNTHRNKVLRARIRQNAGEAKINSAISDWRKVVDSRSVHANDWRRLGITLNTFGRKGASEAFGKALASGDAQPPVSTGKLARRGSTKSLSEINQHPIPMEKETALWDYLYGSHVPTANEVPELSRQIKLFKLGWFEKLAEYRLYSRSGDTVSALRIQTAAMVAAKSGGRIISLEVALIIMGVLMWFGIGITAVVNKIDAVPKKLLPKFERSSLIDYQTGMIAFLLYFLSMTFIGVPLAFFRPLLISMAPAQLLHLEMLLQLVLYFPVLGITLGGMRAVCSIKKGRTISWRQLFSELGLRSDSFPQEIAVGVGGFILILPVFLVISGISHLIFSKYHTPINPAQLEIFAVQNGWDRVALILGVAVAGPIVEEIMFRGVLFQTLLSRFRILPSILISGAVFALVHPTLPAGFLPIWLLGSGFALIFTRRNSLIANIVMHCLHNGLIIATGFAMMAK